MKQLHCPECKRNWASGRICPYCNCDLKEGSAPGPVIRKENHTITIDESERQMILMALAHLAVHRPGWKWTLGETAKKMDNVVDGQPRLFNEFWKLRHEVVRDSLPEEPTGETLNKALAKFDKHEDAPVRDSGSDVPAAGLQTGQGGSR